MSNSDPAVNEPSSQVVSSDSPLLMAEYEQIAENVRHCVTILWEAFKTYFTVIALLFAGYYTVALEKAGTVERQLRIVSRYSFPVGGVVLTLLAGFAIRRIIEHEGRMLERAAAIEKQLDRGNCLYTEARASFRPGWWHLDYLAYAALVPFGLAWLALLAYSVIEDISTGNWPPFFR